MKKSEAIQIVQNCSKEQYEKQKGFILSCLEGKVNQLTEHTRRYDPVDIVPFIFDTSINIACQISAFNTMDILERLGIISFEPEQEEAEKTAEENK